MTESPSEQLNLLIRSLKIHYKRSFLNLICKLCICQEIYTKIPLLLKDLNFIFSSATNVSVACWIVFYNLYVKILELKQEIKWHSTNTVGFPFRWKYCSQLSHCVMDKVNFHLSSFSLPFHVSHGTHTCIEKNV